MNVKSESPNKLKAAKCHSFTLSCPCVWGGHRGTPRYQCQWDPDFSGELQVIKHFCESALLYTLCILRPQERTDLGHSRIRCNGNAHWLLGDGPNKSAEKAGGKEQHLHWFFLPTRLSPCENPGHEDWWRVCLMLLPLRVSL